MSDKNKKIEKLLLIRQLLRSIQQEIQEVLGVLDDILKEELPQNNATGTIRIKKIQKEAKKLSILEEGRVIEGVFDGENMVGPDSHLYPVPPNYASKSKLVEGDRLKLTIMPDGSFRFKQIAPIERKRMIGQVIKQGDNFAVLAEGKVYKVLGASATYYKISEGDKVTIVVPKNRAAIWCAIENVIKKSGDLIKEIEDIEKIESL